MPKGNGDSKLVNEVMLMEAVDTILSGMQKMFDESNARLDKLEKKVDGLSDQVEDLDEKITVNDRIVNGKIKLIKSTSVSREEFEELREKVNKLEKSFASS